MVRGLDLDLHALKRESRSHGRDGFPNCSLGIPHHSCSAACSATPSLQRSIAQLGNPFARMVDGTNRCSLGCYWAVAGAVSSATTANTPIYTAGHPASFGRAPGGSYPRPALTVTLPECSPRGGGRTPVPVSPPAATPANRTAYTPSRLHRDSSPHRRVAFHEPHIVPAYESRVSSLSPLVRPLLHTTEASR